MEAQQRELIRTIQRGDKLGTLMNKNHYEEVKEYFLAILEEENPTSITSLLSKGHEKFGHLFKEETGWYLYNVKLDLEARGMISHIYTDKKQKRTMISKPTSKLTSTGSTRAATPHNIEVNRAVRSKFHELFGRMPFIIHAPGRANLIGEHTDYNSGFAMPASIDKGIQFAINTSSKETLIHSMKYKQFLSVDLNEIKLSSTPWHNYLLGVLFRMKQKGYLLKNFSCVFDGDLPPGAGLSSSAAMECGFVMALNTVFRLHIKPEEMIAIAQWAEHNFVGVKCGIMDQFASVMGKQDHVVLLDCRRMSHKYLPLDLGKYCLLLCDTNVKHSLDSSEYNVRREECEEGVRIIRKMYPDVQTLRDVLPEMLGSCQKIMPPVIYRRCRYVVQENLRVIAAADDLKKGNLFEFGRKMYETHDGLKLLYEVSCPELDFLVDITKPFHGIVGSRMMGGGFGGCTINIIESTMVGAFIQEARVAYKQNFNRELSYYVVKAGNGTSVIETPSSF